MLTGKVAVVTGGGSGIGAATVRKLAAQGASCVVADVDHARAEQIAASVGPDRATAVQVDVSDWTQMQETVAVRTFGKLDVFCNNAGVSVGKPLLEHDPVADWDPIVAVNQTGVHYGTLAAAKQFVAQGTPGVIVNTASVYGVLAAPLSHTYSATKAAVIALTRSAAYELAEHGIRAVAIAPGRVDTPVFAGFSDAERAAYADEQLRGALTHPSEIADVIAFLASDASNAINGTLVAVDDGYTTFKTR